MSETNTAIKPKLTLKESLSEKSFWVMLFLGFSSGLPILLVFGTLGVWLNEAGIEKSTITYFSWAGLGYGFKFIWAPLIDQLRLPFLTTLLGRRRAWLLLCQLLLILILAAMAMTDPKGSESHLIIMALLAVALGFTSASQDIVIDAYRIEYTPSHLLGISAASYIFGYRTAMIIASTFALIASEKMGSTLEHYNYDAWQNTYFIMATFMLIGIATTFIIREPKKGKSPMDSRGSKQLSLLFLTIIIPFIAVYYWYFPLLHAISFLPKDLSTLSPLNKFILSLTRLTIAVLGCFLVTKWLIRNELIKTSVALNAYWSPIQEFIKRYPLKLVILILLLIGFYRVSDMVLGVIANVFYQDMGFSKEQIGYISKFFGLTITILGSFWGGFLITRVGTMKMLLLGAILSSATNLLFILLAMVGKVSWVLLVVICADNLAGGIANIAFITFLSQLSNIKFTAMQYAIFSSIMALLPRLIGGYSGSIVEATNYQAFFFVTTVMGLPVIWLVWIVGKRLTLNKDKA
ncbi:MAG: AmpG family muropeptide MFS transporter [Ostreibacterium sp.]